MKKTFQGFLGKRAVKQMNRIDLHIHSYYSDDGELSPAEIVRTCRQKSLHTIAITDHNSVQGVAEAVHYGDMLGVEVIPGIEIDCTFAGVNLHLLGYGIDPRNQAFDLLEQAIRQQEQAVLPQKLANLRALGLPICEAEILQQAGGRCFTGELIAEMLLSRPENKQNKLLQPYYDGGSRGDMPYLNFYRDFLAQGKLAHVPIEYPTLAAALRLIKDSHGLPVLAHPGETLQGRLDLLEAIIGEGIMGIEVYSNYHSRAQIDYFHQKAAEHQLFVSGGSDFHGKNKPRIDLGSVNCASPQFFLPFLPPHSLQ